LILTVGLTRNTGVLTEMAQSFGDGFQLVEVTTDELVRGTPKKQIWVPAAKPEQAIALVLAELPEGWTAILSDSRLTPEEAALLKMRPGEVRKRRRENEGRLLSGVLRWRWMADRRCHLKQDAPERHKRSAKNRGFGAI
jgi:hypothetical protein